MNMLLSEAAQREEDEDQSRLQEIDVHLKTLDRRKAELIASLRQLEETQTRLLDSRRPTDELLERTNDEHRALGRRMIELRKERDAARDRVEHAVIDARLLRAPGPRPERHRPDALRREARALELKQQTTVLPLAEENALINRLRELSRLIAAAETDSGQLRAEEEKRRQAEEAIRARRAELEAIGREIEQTHHAREQAMQTMRATLQEAGRLVAEIRDNARARRATVEVLRALSGQIMDLEHEGNRLLRQSQLRRDDARRALREHSRPSRGPAPIEATLNASADAHLEELLKRGRVTLGG